MTNTQASLKPLVSTATRIAAALAVVGFVAAAWTGTEYESHRAVQSAAAAITGPLYVTLPSVEIVGRRMKSGEAVAAL
jgi:hypothetical protein